jgi:hypothetical protein
MLAGELNLTIEQGATFLLTLIYQDDTGAPANLTGYTARMKLRKNSHSGQVAIELTTENGRISINGVAGQINLTISATETAALSDHEIGVYDLELVNGEIVERLVEGSYTISPEVTR